MVHNNVNPWNIYIDPSGNWLLGGLGFIGNTNIPPCTMMAGNCASSPHPLYLPPRTFTNKDAGSQDFYALGMIAWEFIAEARKNEVVPAHFQNTEYAFNHLAAEALPTPNLGVKAELSFVNTLINGVCPDPEHPAYKCEEMEIYESFSEFSVKPVYEKIRFLETRIPKILQLKTLIGSESFAQTKLLPLLLNTVNTEAGRRDYQRIADLILVCICQCLRIVSYPSSAYHQKVWQPCIQPLLISNDVSEATVQALLENTPFLLSLEPTHEIFWTDFLMKCISLPNQERLQTLAIQQIPHVAKTIPRQAQLIRSMCQVSTQKKGSSRVRVCVLEALKELYRLIDQDTLTGVLIPTIQTIVTYDQSTGVGNAAMLLCEMGLGLCGNEKIRYLVPIACTIVSQDTLVDSQLYRRCKQFVLSTVSQFFQDQDHLHGAAGGIVSQPMKSTLNDLSDLFVS